jgi:hypothetical protein
MSASSSISIELFVETVCPIQLIFILSLLKHKWLVTLVSFWVYILIIVNHFMSLVQGCLVLGFILIRILVWIIFLLLYLRKKSVLVLIHDLSLLLINSNFWVVKHFYLLLISKIFAIIFKLLKLIDHFEIWILKNFSGFFLLQNLVQVYKSTTWIFRRRSASIASQELSHVEKISDKRRKLKNFIHVVL